MYIFCSADRTKPGAIFFAYISLETAPDHFIMLKLNKLENQTIRPAAEVYDVCAQLCSVAVQFEDAMFRYRYKNFFTILRLKYLLSILILLYDI